MLTPSCRIPVEALAEPEELCPVLARDGWSVAFLKSHYQPATGSSGGKSDHTLSPSHVQGTDIQTVHTINSKLYRVRFYHLSN